MPQAPLVTMPPTQSETGAGDGSPEPLTPAYPCVVCGQTERWDDHGIWRCKACWPQPLTTGRFARLRDNTKKSFHQKGLSL